MNAPVPSVCETTSLPCELDPVFERALAKDPRNRYESAGEFVAALRAAMAEAAGSTRALPALVPPQTAATRPLRREEAAYAPYRPSGRATRSAWPLFAALLLVGAIAGGLLAYFLTRGDTGTTTVVTHVRRVTTQGQITTVEKPVTITTTASTPSTATTSPSQSGSALNDAGFAKMQAGDYTGALPLLGQAVQMLQGTGSLTEAYASYNLAFTRLQLGNCDGVLSLLDRSESLQGRRKDIDRLRKRAEKQC